jgi:hypothetical protein
MRALIPAYRLGLLDAEEALVLRAHLRACATCRDAFEPYTELTDDEVEHLGHLSLGLLSRWDHVMECAPEPLRRLLEAHVADCARCREARDFSRSMRASRRPRARRKAWLGFGTAAIAAIVAAVVVVTLRTPEKRPVKDPEPTALGTTSDPDPATPGTIGARVARDPGLSRVVRPRGVRARTLTIASTERSGAGRIVEVPAGADILPIRVPPLLGVGPDARIKIRVDGPGGVPFGRAEVRHRTLFGSTGAPTLEARAPDGPLPAGHYRVEVVSDSPDSLLPGGFERADYEFDLRAEAR